MFSYLGTFVAVVFVLEVCCVVFQGHEVWCTVTLEVRICSVVIDAQIHSHLGNVIVQILRVLCG